MLPIALAYKKKTVWEVKKPLCIHLHSLLTEKIVYKCVVQLGRNQWRFLQWPIYVLSAVEYNRIDLFLRRHKQLCIIFFSLLNTFIFFSDILGTYITKTIQDLGTNVDAAFYIKYIALKKTKCVIFFVATIHCITTTKFFLFIYLFSTIRGI